MTLRIQLLILIITSFSSLQTNAQIGGNYTFQFLNLPSAARIASMGGTYISAKDEDLNLILQNPAALNTTMHNQIALNFVDYLMDVKYGYVAYARNYKTLGTFAVGMQYINYGEFIAADVNGLQTGTFRAAEYSFNLNYAKPFADSLLSVGVALKGIYSHLETYTAGGIAADVGLTYYNPKINFCMSLVGKNIGTQVKTYTKGNTEPIPFELQFGISKKLAKAPFRFNLNITHLEKFDLTYTNPLDNTQTDPVTGEPVEKKYTTGNKIMRHMIPGLEIIFSKNFQVRFAYNFQRRNELGLPSRMALVGMSAGVGIKISKFIISYGRAVYSLAGGTNSFSVAFDLDEFGKKKKL